MIERIDATPTQYNGTEYRSRTEARWAVFFDGLKVNHEYEAKTLELSDGTKYLPDFYLPEFNTYFEVKPNSDQIVTNECVKARKLSRDLQQDKTRVWLSTGGPSEQTPNIIPLSDWKFEDDIGLILASRENRYVFHQDRRDEGIFWLYSSTAAGWMRTTYLVGGWGDITDHNREPLMFGLVEKAYKSARAFKFLD